MIGKTLVLTALIIGSLTHLGAQTDIILQGKIIDKDTHAPLPAFVQITGTGQGRTADYDGTFKLLVKQPAPDQVLTLTVYLIGYQKKIIPAQTGKFMLVELELEPLPSHEITVSADSVVSAGKAQNTVSMDKMEVYTFPGTAADPIYASQILPGVNSLPDSSNMLIRGGGPDEVAYFFDGIEIAHPFLSESLHESYFSIFDNQIIEGFSVSGSGYPTKFGDALSGVMNITAKDRIFQREGGLGISIMGLNSYLGMPIKDKGSLVGSFNMGHSALMTRINNRRDSEFQTKNGFLKSVFQLHQSHTLRLLGLFDTYDFNHTNGFKTSSRNGVAGISLTSIFSKNLVSRFIFSHVRYQAGFQIEDSFHKDLSDNIYQFRGEATWDLESHYLDFGADIQWRDIKITWEESGGFPERRNTDGSRWGFYINDKFRISRKLYLDLGARLGCVRVAKTQFRFDPRFSLAYLSTPKDIFRFSLGMYHQFGDYFYLKDNQDLKPKGASHISLSYDRITANMDFRLTAYNKEYSQLFLNTAGGGINNAGLGFARGAELYLKLKNAKYDFLLVYNFLNSRRKENQVASLARSPYEIDHSLTGIFTLKFNNTSLGIRYSFASGLPYTPLLGREWDHSQQIFSPVWGEPYTERFPSYQRLDINGSKTFIIDKKQWIFYFGITNLFNRKNILRYEYSQNYSQRNNQYSIFGRSIFLGIYIPFY